MNESAFLDRKVKASQAKEAAFDVAELGMRLPPDVEAAIYAQVVAKLARQAGIRRKGFEAQVDTPKAPTDWME
jgi:hypothetical protein